MNRNRVHCGIKLLLIQHGRPQSWGACPGPGTRLCLVPPGRDQLLVAAYGAGPVPGVAEPAVTATRCTPEWPR